MNRKDFVRSIVQEMGAPKCESVEVFAPINIALIKYWGKRDSELMLPFNANLSVTFHTFGTKTICSPATDNQLWLNGERIPDESDTFRRVFQFFTMVCGEDTKFLIKTINTIPTAAGLASSASSFASFALAIDALYQLNLSKQQLAKIARLGSVSAGRSIFEGFVQMDADGFCEINPVSSNIKDLYIGVVLVSSKEKAHKSRENMAYTVERSVFYEAWLQIVKRDLKEIKKAMDAGDFFHMGSVAERNALCMHASISMLQEEGRAYLTQESLAVIRKVQSARKDGLPIFCTMDAGPNVKLLFQSEQLKKVQVLFPEMALCERVI